LAYLVEGGDGVRGADSYRVSLCLESVHGAFGCASDVSWGGVVIGDFVEYG
jgi:hypothetical protein